MKPGISVIVPVLNEEQRIVSALQALQALRHAGHEVIVVDGGSVDATCSMTNGLADQLLHCAPGRARQMQLGVSHASGELYWFVHGDTLVSEAAIREIQKLAESGSPVWGRFCASLSGHSWFFRVIEYMMNVRSRWTGIATGDQALFIHKCLYSEVGGWPGYPLMEDIAISRRLRKRQAPFCSSARVETSSRRWETQGVIPTILLMWSLRLAYFIGVSPERLAPLYTRK